MKTIFCRRCGAEYNAASWSHLDQVGTQEIGDGGPDLVLRNCACGTTLGVEVPNGYDLARLRDLALLYDDPRLERIVWEAAYGDLHALQECRRCLEALDGLKGGK